MKEKSDERREHKWKHKILTDSCKGKGKLFFPSEMCIAIFPNNLHFTQIYSKKTRRKRNEKEKRKKKYKTSEFTQLASMLLSVSQS